MLHRDGRSRRADRAAAREIGSCTEDAAPLATPRSHMDCVVPDGPSQKRKDTPTETAGYPARRVRATLSPRCRRAPPMIRGSST